MWGGGGGGKGGVCFQLQVGLVILLHGVTIYSVLAAAGLDGGAGKGAATAKTSKPKPNPKQLHVEINRVLLPGAVVPRHLPDEYHGRFCCIENILAAAAAADDDVAAADVAADKNSCCCCCCC